MSRVRNKGDSPPPYTITKRNGYNKDEEEEEEEEEDEDEDEEEYADEESIAETTDTSSSDKLSWLSKIAYASVGLPYSMELSIIAFYINEFLLDTAKVSPAYNAIILFTSRLIDGLTDPIGGYLFSRCSFRWGKMRPW
ncbi:unnamed protein product [Rotaria sp. Silwood2]|nr:unnamed protein product [Rotaria sp. Silwood2]